MKTNACANASARLITGMGTGSVCWGSDRLTQRMEAGMKLTNTFAGIFAIGTLLVVLAPATLWAQDQTTPSRAMTRELQDKIDRCTIRTRFMAEIESLKSIIGRGLCSPQSLNHYEDRVLQFIAECTLMKDSHGLYILPEAFTADALYNLDNLLADCKAYLQDAIERANARTLGGQS